MLTAEKAVVQGVYDSSDINGQQAIERIFGAGAVKRYPPGIWCLATDGSLVKANEWNLKLEPQGVAVITEKPAFIVALHASAALQFGAMDQVKSDMVRDIESYDSKAATDAIIAAYKDTHYQDGDGKIWDVYGAPAAEFCREYSLGNIGAGDWDLPTKAVLDIISENRDDINDCIMAMGGYRLTGGAYISSIEKDDNTAWCVGMGNGDTYYYYKLNTYYVRAVSAFPPVSVE